MSICRGLPYYTVNLVDGLTASFSVTASILRCMDFISNELIEPHVLFFGFGGTSGMFQESSAMAQFRCWLAKACRYSCMSLHRFLTCPRASALLVDASGIGYGHPRALTVVFDTRLVAAKMQLNIAEYCTWQTVPTRPGGVSGGTLIDAGAVTPRCLHLSLQHGLARCGQSGEKLRNIVAK